VKYPASTDISDKSRWSQSRSTHPFAILGGEATSAFRLFLLGVLGAGVFNASVVVMGDGVLCFARFGWSGVSLSLALLVEAFGGVLDVDLALGVGVTSIGSVLAGNLLSSEDGPKWNLGALAGILVAIAGTAVGRFAANGSRLTTKASSAFYISI
jgi:hypothetical protein